MRRISREINIGGVVIGGDNPIAIQSMTNTPTADADATIAQIKRLEEAGCEIVRATVNTPEAAEGFAKIKKAINIPLVADIHFDYKLAIAAIDAGADKIRINPGNIGEEERVHAVVCAAKYNDVPIRIGVNSGSLEKYIVERDGGVTAAGLAESAMNAIRLVEDMGHDKLVLSIKSSDVPMCIEAHEIIADKMDYPIHVGITEAGTLRSGVLKSAVGLGGILSRGIGDTIRVSLSADPVEEVLAAKRILKVLGLRKGGINVISCPTCGRTQIDLISLANKVEDMAENYPDLSLNVAVMGCVVNGPGEAKEADIGIAGGVHEGLLIKKGEIVKKLPEEDLLSALKYELDNWNK